MVRRKRTHRARNPRANSPNRGGKIERRRIKKGGESLPSLKLKAGTNKDAEP